MRKYKKIKKEIVVKELKSVICNKCGRKEKADYDGLDTGNISNIELSFGFGSKFDLEQWEMDICDECLEEWVSEFKHKPDRTSSDLL